MMKYKTSRKNIVSCTPKECLVYAGYGDLQNLLCYHEPVAYTSGMYGWNFDVYEIHGITICTGYRNMPGRRARNCAEYDKKARDIRCNYSLSWHDQKAQVEKLLEDFCRQA